MNILNTQQAADQLGLKPRTVLRLLNSGELRGKRFGNRGWRIPEIELERFLTTA